MTIVTFIFVTYLQHFQANIIHSENVLNNL